MTLKDERKFKTKLIIKVSNLINLFLIEQSNKLNHKYKGKKRLKKEDLFNWFQFLYRAIKIKRVMFSLSFNETYLKVAFGGH